MNFPKKILADPDDSRFNAPWEKTFTKIITPFEEFIRNQTAGSIILMICTLIALGLANSPLAAHHFASDKGESSKIVPTFTLNWNLHARHFHRPRVARNVAWSD